MAEPSPERCSGATCAGLWAALPLRDAGALGGGKTQERLGESRGCPGAAGRGEHCPAGAGPGSAPLHRPGLPRCWYLPRTIVPVLGAGLRDSALPAPCHGPGRCNALPEQHRASPPPAASLPRARVFPRSPSTWWDHPKVWSRIYPGTERRRLVRGESNFGFTASQSGEGTSSPDRLDRARPRSLSLWPVLPAGPGPPGPGVPACWGTARHGWWERFNSPTCLMLD